LGTRVAYALASGEVIVLDLTTGQKKPFAVKTQGVLDWVLGDQALLVISDLQENDSYTLRKLPLDSAQPVDFESNPSQYWLTPDRTEIVFPNRVQQAGSALRRLRLDTGVVTAIEGAEISYPSDRVPANNLAFSMDGKRVLWVSSGGSGPQQGVLYEADSGSSKAKVVDMLRLPVVWFSPDSSLMATPVPTGNPNAMDLVIKRFGGQPLATYRSSGGPVAWRPTIP
jgi:hypothetical protein